MEFEPFLPRNLQCSKCDSSTTTCQTSEKLVARVSGCRSVVWEGAKPEWRTQQVVAPAVEETGVGNTCAVVNHEDEL